MPGFFEAISTLKAKEAPKPKVMIDGREIEVTAKKYKEIEKHGEKAYTLKDGKIVRRPRVTSAISYLQLTKAQGKGYKLYDGHPYWPNELAEGGVVWRAKQE